MDRILYSSDRAEAPAHSLRQEKRARQKDPFEVERAEFSRIAHPVIGDDSLSGVTDETFYREDHHEDIIDFANEGNEIGNQVDRHQDISNRARHDQLIYVVDP